MNDDAFLVEKAIRLFLGLGSSAVLVFFFLSGFLIGGKEINNSLKRELNFKRYLFDRLTRLWIVLVPALALTYILNFFTCRSSRISLYCAADPRLASHSDIPPIISERFADLFSNLFFLQPFKGSPWGGNSPLWSLSYEFWYYVVFYSLLVIFMRISRNEMRFSTFYYFLILLVASRILNSDWLILGSIWLSGAFVAHFLNIKAVVTFLRKYQKGRAFKFTFLTLFQIIPVLIILRILSIQIAFPILIFALTFCLAVMSSEGSSRISNRVQRLIVIGSDFSFSLYLIHFPLVALIASYLTPQDRWNMTALGFSLLVGITLGVLLVAYGFAWSTEFNLMRVRDLLRELVRKL